SQHTGAHWPGSTTVTCPGLAPSLNLGCFAEPVDQSTGNQIVHDYHRRCARAREQRSARAVRAGHRNLQPRIAGVRHQRDRELAVLILGGHHKRLGLLDPRVVEHRIVRPGVALHDEITETGGQDREIISAIDDDHLLAGFLQSTGYQLAERTEADDNHMVGETIELVLHVLVLPPGDYGIA